MTPDRQWRRGDLQICRFPQANTVFLAAGRWITDSPGVIFSLNSVKGNHNFSQVINVESSLCISKSSHVHSHALKSWVLIPLVYTLSDLTQVSHPSELLPELAYKNVLHCASPLKLYLFLVCGAQYFSFSFFFLILRPAVPVMEHLGLNACQAGALSLRPSPVLGAQILTSG